MWSYNYSEELYHYGVKGMKWGVRKKYESTGKRRRKAIKQKQNDESKQEGQNEEQKKKQLLSKKQKTALIVGASIVATYAAYKYVDSGKATRLISKGKMALNRNGDPPFKKNLELANPKMTVYDIEHKVMERINPDYYNHKPGTKNNCRRCTFAYEMSRRGYDVAATKSLKGTGQNGIGLLNAVDNSGKKHSIFSIFKDLGSNEDNLSKKLFGNGGQGDRVVRFNDRETKTRSIFKNLYAYPDRARGELFVQWTNGSAHSMAWEIVDGKPFIFDCQTGELYAMGGGFNTGSRLFENVINASTTRLDNVDLNKDFLLRWVKDA